MTIIGVFFICWGPKLVLTVMKRHDLHILQSDDAFYTLVSFSLSLIIVIVVVVITIVVIIIIIVVVIIFVITFNIFSIILIVTSLSRSSGTHIAKVHMKMYTRKFRSTLST